MRVVKVIGAVQSVQHATAAQGPKVALFRLIRILFTVKDHKFEIVKGEGSNFYIINRDK